MFNCHMTILNICSSKVADHDKKLSVCRLVYYQKKGPDQEGHIFIDLKGLHRDITVKVSPESLF